MSCFDIMFVTSYWVLVTIVLTVDSGNMLLKHVTRNFKMLHVVTMSGMESEKEVSY